MFGFGYWKILYHAQTCFRVGAPGHALRDLNTGRGVAAAPGCPLSPQFPNRRMTGTRRWRLLCIEYQKRSILSSPKAVKLNATGLGFPRTARVVYGNEADYENEIRCNAAIHMR